MGLFTREQFADPNEEAGVMMDGLGAALVTWTAMQDHAVSVSDAAKAFNTTPEIIREAVDDAMWIGYYGPQDAPDMQTLELDGL